MFQKQLSKSLQVIISQFSSSRRTRKALEQGVLELRRLLIQADVSVEFAKSFSEEIYQQISRATGREEISGIFSRSLAGALQGRKPQPVLAGRILIVGLNGAGKTTTVAKMAKLLTNDQGGVGLVAADLRRPGAVDQIKTLASQAKVPVFFKTGTPLLQLLEEGRKWGNDYHTVFFDTAGRQETEEELMKELFQTVATVGPDVILYICDGGGGQQLAKAGKIFAETIGVDGIVLTKLDGDSVGGAVLSLIHETGAPVVFSGVGERIDDLEVFDPDKMSRRILGLGGLDEIVKQIESDKHWDSLEIPENGHINLDDFLKTTRMIRKLGSLTKIAKSTGCEFFCGEDGVNEDFHFSRIEAIVNSMTLDERRNPELLLSEGRTERISQGAGVPLGSVLEFLGRFRTMQDLLTTPARISQGSRSSALV